MVSHLRIWHDNGGCGNYGSWNVAAVVVKDAQTGESTTFQCDSWLAVEKGDGKVTKKSLHTNK